MSADRMNQLVGMVSLCSSIVEGIEHLLAHQDQARMKDDAVAGLVTLESNLKALEVDTAVLYETRWIRELLKSWLFAYDREFKNKLYRWYCVVLKELRNLMVAESERCPVCDGKGVPHYGAVLYIDEEKEDGGAAKPVRVLMKCQDCENYYLVKDETADIFFREGIRRSKARCEKLLADIGEFAPEGVMLLVGDEKSQLYKEARKAGYELRAVSPENIKNWQDTEKERYQVIVIDRMSRNQERKEVIMALADYLEDDGILWFDGPDLEKSFRSLEKRGTPVWKEELDEVCLTEPGLLVFAAECGLSVKAFRHVGRISGRIEVIAGRDGSRKEGIIYGTSGSA